MTRDACRVRDISGKGFNALDFHIAFHIGHLCAQDPNAFLHIISKDTGFGPPIAHLKERKVYAVKSKVVADTRQGAPRPAWHRPPGGVAFRQLTAVRVSAAPVGALPVPTLHSLAGPQRLLAPAPRSAPTALLSTGPTPMPSVAGFLPGPGSGGDGEAVLTTHV